MINTKNFVILVIIIIMLVKVCQMILIETPTNQDDEMIENFIDDDKEIDELRLKKLEEFTNSKREYWKKKAKDEAKKIIEDAENEYNKIVNEARAIKEEFNIDDKEIYAELLENTKNIKEKFYPI